jgi:large-conductance mechanosensitive channel
MKAGGFFSDSSITDVVLGIVLGSTLGKVLNILLNQAILPALGADSFKQLKFVLRQADPSNNTQQLAINYGAIVLWLFGVAVTLFSVVMMIKALKSINRDTPAVQ